MRHHLPREIYVVYSICGIISLPYQHAHIGPMYGFTSAKFAIVGPTLAQHWASYVLSISICSALGHCWANAPVQYLPGLGPMLGRYWTDVGPMSSQCPADVGPVMSWPLASVKGWTNAWPMRQSGICPVLGRCRADVGPVSV